VVVPTGVGANVIEPGESESVRVTGGGAVTVSVAVFVTLPAIAESVTL
jgi:hypothetical protein